MRRQILYHIKTYEKGAARAQQKGKSKSKRSLHWKSPACIKKRLSTSAHTSSQIPTEGSGTSHMVWLITLLLRASPAAS
jgi:hypothetical protein